MNRKLLLAVLLGLLALSVGYAVWYSPRQQRVAISAARPAPRVEAAMREKPETAAEQPRVRLEVLERHGEPFPGVKRNLFGSLAPPPPPVLAVPAPPPPPPPPPVIVAPPPAPAPPQQELARFVYLGFLQKGEEKSVFLSSAEGIFIVRKGDRFGRNRQFMVQELSPEKLVLRQGDDPRPIQISLVEQAPLAPARPAPRSLPSSSVRPSVASRPPVPETPEPDLEPADGQSPDVEENPAPGRRRRGAANGSTSSRPPAASTGNGILKPVPTSDFNNLFSKGPEKKAEEEAAVENDQAEAEEVSE